MVRRLRSVFRISLAALGFGAVVCVTTPGYAQSRRADGMCADASVTIEGQPDPRWNDVLARVCADLEAMEDRDPSARIRFIASDEDLVVEVTVADGRSTMRRLSRPLSLRSSLEALVALPPERPTRAPPRPIETNAPTASERSPSAPPSATPAATPPGPVGAELAFGASGRLAGSGHSSVGGVADAYLLLGHWLFGLWARWDAFQHVSAPPDLDVELDTVGAGVTIARRFHVGFGDLDIGIVPRLIVENQSWEREVPSAPGRDDDDDDEGDRTTTDVRLATFGRLHFGRGPLRAFAGIDGEVSPPRLRRKVRAAPGVPALPAWSAGLTLGVSWTGL